MRTLYYWLFRRLLLARCALDDLAPAPNLPPALLRFRVCESLDRANFRRIGQRCAQLIEQHLASQLLPNAHILDFACGCGRTLTWLIPAHPETHFEGADIDAPAIAWCRSHFPSADFATTLPAGPFDAIYAISLFTHLAEPHQDALLAKLSQNLHPRGVLLFTVHGANSTHHLRPTHQAQLAQQGFLHLQSSKLRGIVPANYHTTWHTPAYLRARLAPHFAHSTYHPVPDGLQDVVLAYKSTPSEN